MAVSLVSILKNEESGVRRMLESILPYVTEAIIVDTGSIDSTVEIVSSYPVRLFHYSWADDFSAARNFALNQASQKWRIVLDGDEWLVRGGEWLSSLSADHPSVVGRIEIQSFYNDPSELEKYLCSTSLISRLLPMGVFYRGAIHEQVVHSLPIVDTAVVLHHDGYTDAKRAKKRGRNKSLLESALKQSPRDPYLLFQYSRELKISGSYEDALAVFQSIIPSSLVRARPWWEEAVCLGLELYAEEKLFSTGLKLIDSESQLFSRSVDFWYSVGIFSVMTADHYRSTSVYDASLVTAENAFTRCLALGAEGQKSKIVCGRESNLAIDSLTALKHRMCERESER